MNFRTVAASPVFRVLSAAVTFMACIPVASAASLYYIGSEATESIPLKWITGIDAVYDDRIIQHVPAGVTLQWAVSHPGQEAGWLRSIIGSERDVALAGILRNSFDADPWTVRQMLDGLPWRSERDFGSGRGEVRFSRMDRGRRPSGEDLGAGWTEGTEYGVGNDFDLEFLPVVPEPSEFLLGLVGVGMGLLHRCRRHRK